MAKNPFSILGVKEDCTQAELTDAYIALRDKWTELRFEPGEKGKEACEKLTEIENAYRDAQEILIDRYTLDNAETIMDEASNLIKDKRFDEAQEKLNQIKKRNAYWHYLQGGVFYGKHWHNDAERELQLAVSLEPSNMEYRRVLQELQNKKYSTNQSSAQHNYYAFQDQGQRSYSGANNPNNYRRREPDMCDCCTSLLCADCCCECMGGDLIACC